MYRRNLLVTAGTGLVVSLAGCTRSLVGSDSVSSERVARWLPTPDALGVEQYSAQFADVAAVRDAAAEHQFDGYDRTLGAGSVGLDHMGLQVPDVGFLLNWNNFAVFEGIEDTDAAASRLEDEGYTTGEGYEGTQLYTNEIADGEMAVGLGESTAVVAGNVWLVDGEPELVGAKFEVTAPTMVRAVLDASESEDARYTATNDAASILVEEVGDGDFGMVAPHGGYERGYDGEVGHGWMYAVEGDTTTRSDVYVFAEDADLPVDAIEREFNESGIGPYDSGFEVKQSGRVVTVETAMDTNELSPLP